MLEKIWKSFQLVFFQNFPPFYPKALWSFLKIFPERSLNIIKNFFSIPNILRNFSKLETFLCSKFLQYSTAGPEKYETKILPWSPPNKFGKENFFYIIWRTDVMNTDNTESECTIKEDKTWWFFFCGGGGACTIVQLRP